MSALTPLHDKDGNCLEKECYIPSTGDVVILEVEGESWLVRIGQTYEADGIMGYDLETLEALGRGDSE